MLRLISGCCLFVFVLSLASHVFAIDTVLFVDQDSTAQNPDGLTWSTSFEFLQDAFAEAPNYLISPGDTVQIWVAEGSYRPDQATTGYTLNLRSHSFILLHDVKLFGGFEGDETSLDERDPATNITILTGDIGTASNHTDNSFNVVTANDGDITPANCEINGFIVERATAFENTGGGMYFQYASPRVDQCIVRNNLANGSGGGISLDESSAVITRSIIRDNVVTAQFGNTAATVGQSIGYGGGVSSFGGGYINLINCTFIKNQAVRGGGYAQGNNYEELENIIRNCILWENTASDQDAQIHIATNFPNDPGTVVVTYSDVEGGYSGTGVINSDPLFTTEPNPGTDTTWGTSDDVYGNIRLVCNSLAINSGNPSSSSSILPYDEFDLDGNTITNEPTPDHFLLTRVIHLIDMGAVETPPNPCPGDTDNNAVVNVDDLLAVINAWGSCAWPCGADVVPQPCGNGTVDVNDLLAVINGWGECGAGGSFPASLSDCFSTFCNELSGSQYTECVNRCAESYCSQNPTPDDCQ